MSDETKCGQLDRTDDERASQRHQSAPYGHLRKLCEELANFIAVYCPKTYMAKEKEPCQDIDATMTALRVMTIRIAEADAADREARELLCERIDWREDENEELRDLLNTIAFALRVDVHYHADNYTECENEVLAEIDRLQARQMPEGVEWPTVDGREVCAGDVVCGYGLPEGAEVVAYTDDGADSRLIVRSPKPDRDGKQPLLLWWASDCHLPEPETERTPDSWDAIARDASLSASLYCTERNIDADPTAQDAKAKDIVRRAEALAGEGR